MHIITLTSDVGNQDFIAGAIKGQLLQTINQPVQLADITQSLSPFNIPQAAYICRNAIRHFPDNSFHIILVNLFEQENSDLLAIAHNGQFIFCADNGLITMMLDAKPANAVRLPPERNQPRNVLNYITVIGKAINWLMEGGAFENMGDPAKTLVEKTNLKPMVGANWLEGQVIFIDHFENVVVNITKEVFEQHRNGRNFKIVFKRDEVIDRLSEHYGAVAEGEKLALFNSAGYLEIAINQGNAAGLFGLKHYAGGGSGGHYLQNRMFYHTIKIFFE
jgi:S-adenosyl-L-methionine hydrolase (adenosine-forming)